MVVYFRIYSKVSRDFLVVSSYIACLTVFLSSFEVSVIFFNALSNRVQRRKAESHETIELYFPSGAWDGIFLTSESYY